MGFSPRTTKSNIVIIVNLFYLATYVHAFWKCCCSGDEKQTRMAFFNVHQLYDVTGCSIKGCCLEDKDIDLFGCMCKYFGEYLLCCEGCRSCWNHMPASCLLPAPSIHACCFSIPQYLCQLEYQNIYKRFAWKAKKCPPSVSATFCQKQTGQIKVCVGGKQEWFIKQVSRRDRLI